MKHQELQYSVVMLIGLLLGAFVFSQYIRRVSERQLRDTAYNAREDEDSRVCLP